MTIAAALASGGAFFYAKNQIVKSDFNRSIQLIAQDDDAGWCNLANASVVQDREGAHYCAIRMTNYVGSQATE